MCPQLWGRTLPAASLLQPQPASLACAPPHQSTQLSPQRNQQVTTMKHYSAERKEAVLCKLAPPTNLTVPEAHQQPCPQGLRPAHFLDSG